MSDETRRRLEEAGQRPVPGPDPAFVEGLEARLLASARIAMSQAPAAGRIVEARPSPRAARTWRPVFSLAASFAAVALVITVAAWMGGGFERGAPTLELAGASGVEVVLADGTLLVNPDGLLLPEGAVVRVSDGGSARIGGIMLTAGDVARIVDGHARITRPTLAAASGAGAQSDAASTPPADRVPPPSVKPTSATTDEPSPPASSSTAATSRPSASQTAASTRSPLIGPSGDIRTASPLAQATPAAGLKPMELSARATGPSEIGITWTALAGAKRYVVVATKSSTAAAADPKYPGSPVLGEFAHPPGSPLMVRVREGTAEVRLLVVALAADGTELARSNVARVRLQAAAP